MGALIGLAPLAIAALVCLGMMVFMMRGTHGGRGDGAGHSCHGSPADADRSGTPDHASAARLQAMEEQVADLRLELAERNAAKLGLGRQGRS